MTTLHISARSFAASRNPHADALREANRRMEFMLPLGLSPLFLYSGTINELLRTKSARHSPIIVDRFIVKPKSGETLDREMRFKSKNGYENRFIVPHEFVGKPLLLEIRQGFDDAIPTIVPEESQTFGSDVTYFRVEDKFIQPMRALLSNGKMDAASGLFLPDSRKISPVMPPEEEGGWGRIGHLNGTRQAYVGFAMKRNSPIVFGYHMDVCRYDALDLHANGRSPVSITFGLDSAPQVWDMASRLKARLQDAVEISSVRMGVSIKTTYGRVPQDTALLVLFGELAKTIPNLTLQGLSGFLAGSAQDGGETGLSIPLVNRTLKRIYNLKWLWKDIEVAPIPNE
ncbi:MAG: hypothetical protein WC861_06380 [Candidatus Micrarchaeia archaeon]|jgi:hypothetical protein